MNDNGTKLISLFRQISIKAKEAELTARLTGENFNVFKILSLSTNEVRTHSAFIAELLNPRGSHGQGTLYLDRFLSQFGIAGHEFDSKRSKAEVEFPIGGIDTKNSTGGRIDILLTDANTNRIMIENKIYAGDQHEQLLRYHRYDPKAALFYLTLSGNEPSEYSTGKQDFPFRPISYKDDLLEWLTECHKCSVGLPSVRETIFQYICLIRQLTGLTARSKVMEEAKRLIVENPDLLGSMSIIEDAWNSIVHEVKTKYTNLKNKCINKSDYITADGKFYIGVSSSEDVDGQYVGINLRDMTTGKPAGDEHAKKYNHLFKSLVNNPQRNQYWNIGWFNPQPFVRRKKFEESLPRQQILSFYTNENLLVEFVASIKKQVDELVDRLSKLD